LSRRRATAAICQERRRQDRYQAALNSGARWMYRPTHLLPPLCGTCITARTNCIHARRPRTNSSHTPIRTPPVITPPYTFCHGSWHIVGNRRTQTVTTGDLPDSSAAPSRRIHRAKSNSTTNPRFAASRCRPSTSSVVRRCKVARTVAGATSGQTATPAAASTSHPARDMSAVASSGANSPAR